MNQIVSVCRRETDRDTGKQTERALYVNQCETAYKIPEGIKLEEGGVQNGQKKDSRYFRGNSTEYEVSLQSAYSVVFRVCWGRMPWHKRRLNISCIA